MEISLTTPAVIFPAITLLLLAYSNRFSALAKLIRSFSEKEQKHADVVIEVQIKNFQTRLYIIQAMEFFGILALLASVISMIFLYWECLFWGKMFFLMAIVSVAVSLLFALSEVILSTKALHIELKAKVGKKLPVKSLFSNLFRR